MLALVMLDDVGGGYDKVELVVLLDMIGDVDEQAVGALVQFDLCAVDLAFDLEGLRLLFVRACQR